jgi:hypothetical protein
MNKDQIKRISSRTLVKTQSKGSKTEKLRERKVESENERGERRESKGERVKERDERRERKERE